MHPLLAKQPRYCLTCGTLLPGPRAGEPEPRCDHCLRPFDPNDPATFSAEPRPEPRRWWQDPAVPGVAWLVVYGVGCLVIGGLLPSWVTWLGGGAGLDRDVPDPRAGQAAGVLVAVFLVVFGFIPWLFACLYLLLLAVEEHLRDEVLWYLTAGAIGGMLCTLGFHPALLLVGIVMGVFAGLVRQWRMA